ncbi:MAG: GatB/YqeY domain-containing protein, partial [Bacteroidales bacterium]|nr:GatB/YqeY domain-containing protein [Bacteroidales bacterium]
MLAKDKVALASIRGIKAAILLAKTAEGGQKDTIEDGELVKIIQKLVKQRKESAAIYTEQNRPELAENELAEAAVMEKYLPKALSEEEVEAAVKEIISEVGASSMADMGKVMGVATKKLAGQADGRVISSTVKRLLS